MDLGGHRIFDSSVVAGPHRAGAQMLLFGGGGSFFRGPARSFLGIEEAGRPKRPFFTTHDEMLEEEYYDEQFPESKKRRLTPEQVHMLERSFEAENKLEPERKTELAKQLGLAPRQVAVWFQNRRARWKTKQLEQDFDRLKSCYDSLLADHDSLLKDNDRLRSQVTSLTDELQAKESSMVAAAAFQLDYDEQAAASDATAVAMAAMLRGGDDRLSSDTDGSVVRDRTKACVDAEEGHYYEVLPLDGCMPSEEEEGDGGLSDEGCSFFPADDDHAAIMAAGAVEQQDDGHRFDGQDENQLDTWCFWN